MVGQVQWPVFLLDDGDVAVYRDPEDLVAGVESWMANEPVQFLDLSARPLRLRVDRQRTTGVEVASETPQPARLRGALAAYLHAIGKPAPDDVEIQAFGLAAARTIDDLAAQHRLVAGVGFFAIAGALLVLEALAYGLASWVGRGVPETVAGTAFVATLLVVALALFYRTGRAEESGRHGRER